ncbi:methyltransferase [Micavibrio aeruginosavorus]|uniref:methyltransferase n=1 Tax=Micavibrio aeruginosavorus TaxID=349221 RepID=UPI003F4A944C
MKNENPILVALSHGLKTDLFPLVGAGMVVLGIGFDGDVDDDLFPVSATTMVQYWAGPATRLRARGYAVRGDVPDGGAVFDRVIVHVPKQMDEMQYLLAAGWRVLKPGGDLIAVAANDAGGSRLGPVLSDAGLDVSESSKAKCRVVRVVKSGVDVPDAPLIQWLGYGTFRVHPDTQMTTCPGLFSWDRVDAGSALLRDHLPSDLSGVGADFGCGYGFLSRTVLNQCAGVTLLHGLDADARAVAAAIINMQPDGERFRGHHVDIPAGSGLTGLDFIVMNPPFHTGARESHDLGRAFIARAHESLRKGGIMVMVANAHLGYEVDLNRLFSAVNKLYEGGVFKIYQCVK